MAIGLGPAAAGGTAMTSGAAKAPATTADEGMGMGMGATKGAGMGAGMGARAARALWARRRITRRYMRRELRPHRASAAPVKWMAWMSMAVRS
jgi:hypothetical protein